MLVRGGWCWHGRRRGTAFAVHPAAGTVCIEFLFPQWHTVLHFVDDVAAGREGFATVRRADPHPDRQSPDVEQTGAMDTARRFKAKALLRFLQDPASFGDRQPWVGLIGQAEHALAFIMVANPALESNVTPRSRIGERGLLGGHVDSLFAEPELEGGRDLVGVLHSHRFSLPPPVE